MSSYSLNNILEIQDNIQGIIANPNYKDSNLKTGFTSDTKLCWRVYGPYLEVIDAKSGRKISEWTFGSIIKDTTSKITCIEELISTNKNINLLVVGLECMNKRGMICVFDIYSWKVLRAIQLMHKVTSIHVISNGNESTSFPGPLSCLDGALAVGTAGGDIFVIDLCREAINEAKQQNNYDEIMNEIAPCQLLVLTMRELSNIESQKQLAAKNGNHLAIHINALLEKQSPHFILKAPDGRDRLHVNKEEVCISALQYVPQLCSLLVGFNFGALQIWNLLNFRLAYTSPVYEENIPVSYFAIQEPADDPRAFCYIWAVYSHKELYQKSFPISALYSLCYESKDWHDGYGYIYQNLQNCTIKFQMDLSAIDFQHTRDDPVGAQCLRLQSFSKGANKDISTSFPDNFEESYTLCLMVWNVWCEDNTVHNFISIFDLNQWYKEEMPNSPIINHCKSYMTYACISDILYADRVERYPVKDVIISPASLSQFVGSQKLEEHYYPTSLSFDCSTLSDNEISSIRNYGLQGQLYRELELGGPLALIKPTDLYQKSIILGLTPLFMDSSLTEASTLNYQREHLLSVALEYNMINWLCKCALSWGNGSHRSAGLSLDLLLGWAWHRAKLLKENLDKLCEKLFDYSEQRLDFNEHSLLSKCKGQICSLKVFYEYVFERCDHFLINLDFTRKQMECLQRIYAYLDVLSWMVNIGLLPEYASANSAHNFAKEKLSVSYPAESFLTYYKERRLKLKEMNKGKHILETDSCILYIDKIIELCGKEELMKEWRIVGGSGDYPPHSLQALLRTYLLENVDIDLKHSIVTYFLLDLAMTLDKNRYNSIIPSLIKFPSIFNLNISTIKVIQAFWHLDHGDSGAAVEQLINPIIKSSDMAMWQHKLMIEMLTLQDHHKFALLYIKVRKPTFTSTRDILILIKIMLMNNFLHDALILQRKYSNEHNLLKFLINECNEQNLLNQFIELPLTKDEEEELFKFLDEIKYSDKLVFKSAYYLERSRYLDLYNTNNATKKLEKHVKTDKYYENIIGCLENGLPKVTKKVINLCLEDKGNVNKSVDTPKPLSTFLFNNNEQSKYKSSVINASLKKSKELRITDFKLDECAPKPNVEPVKTCNKILRPKLVKELVKRAEAGDEEDSPSPYKKARLSLNESLPTTAELNKLTTISTPIIKRKLFETTPTQKLNVATPQSILKVRSYIQESESRGNSTTPENLDDIISSEKSFDVISDRGTRKSTSRASVRFDDTNFNSISKVHTLSDEAFSIGDDSHKEDSIDSADDKNDSVIELNDTTTTYEINELLSSRHDRNVHTNSVIDKTRISRRPQSRSSYQDPSKTPVIHKIDKINLTGIESLDDSTNMNVTKEQNCYNSKLYDLTPAKLSFHANSSAAVLGSIKKLHTPRNLIIKNQSTISDAIQNAIHETKSVVKTSMIETSTIKNVGHDSFEETKKIIESSSTKVITCGVETTTEESHHEETSTSKVTSKHVNEVNEVEDVNEEKNIEIEFIEDMEVDDGEINEQNIACENDDNVDIDIYEDLSKDGSENKNEDVMDDLYGDIVIHQEIVEEPEDLDIIIEETDPVYISRENSRQEIVNEDIFEKNINPDSFISSQEESNQIDEEDNHSNSAEEHLIPTTDDSNDSNSTINKGCIITFEDDTKESMMSENSIEIVSLPSSKTETSESGTLRETTESSSLNSKDELNLLDINVQATPDVTNQSDKSSQNDHTLTTENELELNKSSESKSSSDNTSESTNKQSSEITTSTNNTTEASGEPIVLKIYSKEKQDLDNIDSDKQNTVETPKKPAKRNMRSQSSDVNIERKLSLRRRSVDVAAAPPRLLRSRRSSTNSELQNAEEISVKTKLRTRSASVNDIPIVMKRKAQKTPEKGRSPILLEEDQTSSVNSRKRKQSQKAEIVENYSTSRRLTRKQKELLENTIEANVQKLDLAHIDPMILLDKEDFKGVKDPDEVNILQRSPASSIASSNATGSIKKGQPRRLEKPQIEVITTPTRKSSRLSHSQTDSPISTRRTRSKSIEIEEKPVTPRRRRGSTDSLESIKSASSEILPRRSTRSRTKSESSESEPEVMKTKRGRKSILQKTELSVISEESTIQEPEEQPVKAKRGRPRKQ